MVDKAFPLSKREDQDWHIANRWQEFEGEGRICILRVAMVLLFYSTQLTHALFWSDGSQEAIQFHRQATAVAVVWLLLSLGIGISLARAVFPSWLKYVSSLSDLTLLTILAWLGSGPASPLISIYGVIIVLGLLRWSLSVQWTTTLGAIAGYLFLVGSADATWFDAQHTTAPIHQAVTISALFATGLATDQILRAIRSYARSIQSSTSIHKDAGSDRG